MTQTPPREESTFRWLWRLGPLHSVLAIGFIGMTLLQSALEQLPDPSEQQWEFAELAFVFYFATAAAQGIAAQTAAQIDRIDRTSGRWLGLTMAIGPEVSDDARRDARWTCERPSRRPNGGSRPASRVAPTAPSQRPSPRS